MARIGLKKAQYALIDPERYKYFKYGSLDKIIEEKFAPEFNSAELYADDTLAESDYSFKKGTLTITVANDDDKTEAELMGHKYETSGYAAKRISDVAPEVGYGHIVTKIVNGVRKYKVEFFPRVKFNKITTDAKTRGENVEFGTTTIEGVVYPLDKDSQNFEAGTWEVHQTFDTEENAEEFLDECMMAMPEE